MRARTRRCCGDSAPARALTSTLGRRTTRTNARKREEHFMPSMTFMRKSIAALLLALGAICPVAAQEPIKIGFSVSLTGGLASSGKAHLLSKQIWAEQINARGGLLSRPVKLVYYDDQTNAATVPGIYAKLIDEIGRASCREGV